jgi:hypothetical protein
MRQLIASASASILEAANRILESPASWPEPANGLACRILARTGTPLAAWMSKPLRVTSAGLLRRTPEIAAFGYVLDRANPPTLALWLEAIERLRGREIYPPDRQSFIFNPIEILGVASGLMLPLIPAEHRSWFSATILRGVAQDQFRTPLSRRAAQAALALVDDATAGKVTAPALDVSSLGTPDLILAAAICLAFGSNVPGEEMKVQQALILRVLSEPLTIGDAAEASALGIVIRRGLEQFDLSSPEVTSDERVVSLCRRFPLFVERLQSRQRNRLPFAVNDEYDVQDLLHAVLKLHFEDIRPEEYTPSYAGNSSRVDFFLPRERVIVEAKMTRAHLGQKEVANELAIDVARYAQMPRVDTLICLIYDPGRYCDNPKTLENDIEASKGRLRVRAIVCPQGL